MGTTVDRSAIEAAMNTVMHADATLHAAITTFQAGFSVDVEEDRINTLGFAASQLPACMSFIRTIIGEQVRMENDTIGEDINYVPCSIMVIDRKGTHAAALSSVVVVQEMVERIVKKQVTSSLCWGGQGDTMLETVRGGISSIEEGRQMIVIGEVLFDMMVFTERETA